MDSAFSVFSASVGTTKLSLPTGTNAFCGNRHILKARDITFVVNRCSFDINAASVNDDENSSEDKKSPACDRRTMFAISTGLLAGSLFEQTAEAATRKENGVIYDTHSHSFLPPRPSKLGSFSNALKSEEVGIVCIGETHTHPLHHRLQLRTIQGVHRMDAKPMAIGLEMFLREHQPILDNYVAGKIGLGKLLREVSWNKTWGYDFRLYAPIFRYARLNGIPLVGLNASPALVHDVASKGIEGLSPVQRAELPEMDVANEAHLTQFVQMMAAYGHGNMSLAKLRNYYFAKTLWDEYMAESVCMFLEAYKEEEPQWRNGGRMVVLAGNGHVEGRVGVPDRITRRIGAKPFVIVPEGVSFEEGLPVVDELPIPDAGDWFWYTRREIDLV